MSKKAEVINLERSEEEKSTEKSLQLDSGRHVLVHSDERGELLFQVVSAAIRVKIDAPEVFLDRLNRKRGRTKRVLVGSHLYNILQTEFSLDFLNRLPGLIRSQTTDTRSYKFLDIHFHPC